MKLEEEQERREVIVTRSEHDWLAPQAEVSAIARWVLERWVIGYGVPCTLAKIVATWPLAIGFVAAVAIALLIMLGVVHWKAWQEGNIWAALSALFLIFSGLSFWLLK